MAQPAEKRESNKATAIKDAAFNWEDPLDLEGELTEEERMVRDTARDYAQDKLMPRVLEGLSRGELRSGGSCARWASSACSARPSRRNTAAPASATSPTA